MFQGNFLQAFLFSSFNHQNIVNIQQISEKCLNESVESNLMDYTVAAAFYFGASFDTTADLILNERTLEVTISV